MLFLMYVICFFTAICQASQNSSGRNPFRPTRQGLTAANREDLVVSADTRANLMYRLHGNFRKLEDWQLMRWQDNHIWGFIVMPRLIGGVWTYEIMHKRCLKDEKNQVKEGLPSVDAVNAALEELRDFYNKPGILSIPIVQNQQQARAPVASRGCC